MDCIEETNIIDTFVGENIPAKDKMSTPHYQSLLNNTIPKILLKNDAGYVRIVAGQFQNTRGIAQTFSPMNVLDVHLKKGYQITLPANHGDTTLIYLRRGKIQFSADEDLLEEQAMAMMSSFDTDVQVTALENCDLLFLSAPPLHEPINGHGFFVMNHYDEILQAYEDLKTGQFGKY